MKRIVNRGHCVIYILSDKIVLIILVKRIGFSTLLRQWKFKIAPDEISIRTPIFKFEQNCSGTEVGFLRMYLWFVQE